MTKNDNVSRLSYKWRTLTKECCICEFKKVKDDKKICDFGGIKRNIFTKTNRVFTKCILKEKK
jgi:hypothetical protein